jgi:hypothetical protein
MTVPPDEGRDPHQGPGAQPSAGEQPLDFDPYRFGKPDHPIPPEYAPPGYVPPAPSTPPSTPVWPPTAAPQQYHPGYPPAGGGYTPHPPPAPGYQPYGAPRTGNGRATTALVLGILAILFFWLTLLDLALAVPAIVFGALALRDANRFPERGGRNKAIAGLICGVLSVVLVIATIAVLYTRVKPCMKYGLYSDRYNSCVQDRL